MLVAAAFCPAPPLLVPAVASGAAAELDAVRRAVDQATRDLRAAQPDLLVVVGDGPRGDHPGGSVGSLAGFGLDVTVALGSGRAGNRGPTLPTSLTVGAWLLAHSGWSGAVTGVSVPPDLATPLSVELGEAVSARAQRVALLVLGESSARLDARAPGAFDPDAPLVHAGLSTALATVDRPVLLGLDEPTASRLMISGRVPWQLAVGASLAVTLRGRVIADEAPYGVGYLVASWTSR